MLLWNPLDQSVLQRAVLGLHPETLRFSADGAHLLAASLREDGLQSAAQPTSRTVRVWEVIEGKLLLDLALDGTVQRLALSEDAHWLATASGALSKGFTTQLWEIPAPQGAGLTPLNRP